MESVPVAFPVTVTLSPLATEPTDEYAVPAPERTFALLVDTVAARGLTVVTEVLGSVAAVLVAVAAEAVGVAVTEGVVCAAAVEVAVAAAAVVPDLLTRSLLTYPVPPVTLTLYHTCPVASVVSSRISMVLPFVRLPTTELVVVVSERTFAD